MYIASASSRVALHDFATTKVVQNYQPKAKQRGPIRSLSWNKDGKWLIIVPHIGSPEILLVGECLQRLKTIDIVAEPSCASFQNSNKKCIGIGTSSGLTVIYDLKSKKTTKRFRGGRNEITHVKFTAQDSHCVSTCKDGHIYVFNYKTSEISRNLVIPHSQSVTSMNTHPLKKNLVLAGSNEGTVMVWDINYDKSKFKYSAHQTFVTCCAFSPINHDLIMTAGQDSQCCFFDIKDGKRISTLNLDNSVSSMDLSPDGKFFALGHQNGLISIYDTRNIQKAIKSSQAHESAVKHISFQTISSIPEEYSTAGDISLETVAISTTVESRRHSDFFSVSTYSPEQVDSGKNQFVEGQTQDSFLAALGFDSSMNELKKSENIEGSLFGENASSTPKSAEIPRNKLILCEESPTPTIPSIKITPSNTKNNQNSDTTEHVKIQNSEEIKNQCDVKQPRDLIPNSDDLECLLDYRVHTLQMQLHQMTVANIRDYTSLKDTLNVIANDQAKLIKEVSELKQKISNFEGFLRLG